MGIAVRRPTGAAARCASEAARSTAKASRRGKKEQTRFGNFTHDTRRPSALRSRCGIEARRRDSCLAFANKSRAPAVRQGFEGAAKAPAVTVLRARRKHQHYVAIEVSRGDDIQGPCGRLAVPNRSACRQRAIAICDLNFGPFPRPIGPESGTDFGARLRHSNRTAGAQV